MEGAMETGAEAALVTVIAAAADLDGSAVLFGGTGRICGAV
jgi:hypothetical protein